MGREQGLVARDHVGPGIERLQDEGTRGLETAHEFDHDIRTEDEGFGIRRQEFSRDLRRTPRREVTHGNADEFEPGSCPIREFVAVLDEERGNLCPHRSGTQQGYSEVAVLDHCAPFVVACPETVDGPAGAPTDSATEIPASRESRSASVSRRTITRARPSRTATTAGRPR